MTHVEMFFFTESWLSSKITDSMIDISGFSVLRCDRLHSVGGGVALYYKNHLNIKQVFHSLGNIPCLDNFEYLCVDYSNGINCVRFICCYLPPKFASCTETVKSLCNLIGNLTSDNSKPSFLIGDFNLPKMDWKVPSSFGGASHDIFLNFCINNNWTQQVSQSTHAKNNILDLLLCNYSGNNILLSSNVSAPLSTTCDHNLVSFSLSTSVNNTPCKPPYPDFKNADYNNINADLSNINWSSIYSGNLQDFYDNFISILNRIIDARVPIVRPKKHSFKLPKHIKVLLKEKLNAYKHFKSNPSLKSVYIQKCSQYEQEVKKWNNSNEYNLCRNPSSKKFYNYINKKLKVKSAIPTLINKDTIASTDYDKAAMLNCAFNEVFTVDNGKSPGIKKKTTHHMSDFCISREDIVNAISSMKDKITRTPEGVPAYFLKRTADALIEPLYFFFNRCLIFSFVPRQWKMGLVVPIFKKGDKSNCKNYRPISLTSTFSRLFESILYDKITYYLLEHSLISSSQFGFLPGRSSCQQLLVCVHEWLLSVCKGMSVNVIYTDIAKAFDSVCHKKLIQVVQSYGINESVVCWLSNFLSDRKQSVCVGSSVSSFLPVSSGVPQGSVIGPLLFLIYFDNITTSAPTLHGSRGIKLFADDAKLYDNNSSTLQISLNNFIAWLVDHQLDIASHKCFSLDLASPNLTHNSSTFYINNSAIESKPLIKDLGIYVSCDLKWASHINYICRNASFCSYQIMKCFKTKFISTLIKLYKTYVRPKIEYNSSVWSPWLSKDIDQLESIQRKFTKFAFNRCNIPFHSYFDRLRQINLQTLEHRRLIFDIILLYKIINNLCFIRFSDYFSYKNCTYNLRRNSLQIQHNFNFKIKSQSSLWQNVFFVRIVKVWNSLPDEVVTARSLNVFKIKLKKADLSNHLSLAG